MPQTRPHTKAPGSGCEAYGGGLRWVPPGALALLGCFLGAFAVDGLALARVPIALAAVLAIAAGGYLAIGYVFVARAEVVDRERAVRAQRSPPDGAAASPELTERLSRREVEVLRLVAGGATNDKIAARLVLSPRTVQSHLLNAMKKTGTRNRTELAVLAVIGGLSPAWETRPVPGPPAPDRFPATPPHPRAPA